MSALIFQNLKDGISAIPQTTTSSDIVGSCLTQAEKNALLNELADWGTPMNGGGNLSGVVTSVGLVTSIANATITSPMIVGTLTSKIVNGVNLSTAGPATEFLNKSGTYTTPVGEVSSVSVLTANGVSGTVATPTTTPAITLTLGAITPTSVVSAGPVTGTTLTGTSVVSSGAISGTTITGTTLTGTSVVSSGAISGTTVTATGAVTFGAESIATSQALSGNGAVAAVNLTTTVTTIENTGVANTTTTLAAGTNGQYKEIAFIVDGGFDAVITVTNPAWGGAGTITLDAVGDSVSMRYLGSLWVILSNNGSVLA